MSYVEINGIENMRDVRQQGSDDSFCVREDVGGESLRGTFKVCR